MADWYPVHLSPVLFIAADAQQQLSLQHIYGVKQLGICDQRQAQLRRHARTRLVQILC